MIHLQKQTNATSREGIVISRMACVNDPFIQGRLLPLDEFIAQPIENCCKKCLKIAKRIKK